MWLAGSAAMLFAAFILFNSLFTRPGGIPGLAERQARDEAEILPVMETLNYRSEARNASLDPGTVYILENVSFASDSRIRY